MTSLTSNNQITDPITTPIKIALVGVSMIQQSLLEFYFATKEGSRKYKVVLGKEADAYITNFDQSGSLEAWDNLYAQEEKPTLVLSNHYEIINNYLYLPKPITPQVLADAAISIQHLLKITLGKQSKASMIIPNETLQFPVDPSAFSKEENSTASLINTEEESFAIDNEATTDQFSLPEEDIAKQEEQLTLVDQDQEKLKQEQNKLGFAAGLDTLGFMEETNKNQEEKLLNQATTKNDEKLEKEITQEFDEFLSLQPHIEQQENKDKVSSPVDDDIFAGLEMFDDIAEDLTPPIEKENKKEAMILPDINLVNNESPNPSIINEETSSLDENLSSPDELQHFLDELNEKNLESNEKKVSISTEKKKKQQKRWKELCGEYNNDSYDKNSGINTVFKREETLLPYVIDTIAFTERASCWMELAYNPLSILINPETKHIYSNVSIHDPLFVQMCSGKIVEELIEFLEVSPEKVTEITNNQLSQPLFKYEIGSFLWTVSLLVSRGRLPEDVDPNKKMSITNWLNLNKVEKFPYIMQIAAVFNRQHASLNETSNWLTLPKRYVYAFYNGVEALDMIKKNPEEDDISMGSNNTGQHDGMIKNLLFKKII